MFNVIEMVLSSFMEYNGGCFCGFIFLFENCYLVIVNFLCFYYVNGIYFVRYGSVKMSKWCGINYFVNFFEFKFVENFDD